MAGKKGSKYSRAMSNQQRDSIALSRIENYIDGQLDKALVCPECGKEHGAVKDLTPAQVALIRARYDKLRPTLSAVDQTVHEEPKGEQQVIQELRSLFLSKPELFHELTRAMSAEQQSSATTPTTTH